MNSKTSFTVVLIFTFYLLAESGELIGKVTAASGGGELADALVYVVSRGQRSAAVPQRGAPSRTVWTIRGGQLDPQVFVAQAGESFTITNADAKGYNVHVRFQNNTERNQALTPKDQTLIKAEQPELFARASDDLGQLRGYVCVLEHRVYALTDAAGTFKLTDLPLGTYSIAAAHPRTGRLEREVTIGSAVTTSDFKLPAKEER